MKIVFDTNVLLSAFATQGLSYRVLDICLDKHKLYISKWIIDEVTEKLGSKFLVEKKIIKNVLSFIESEFILVQPTGELPNKCRDKDDNNVLHLANSCGAHLILTGDKDLLTLKTYKKIHIINPRRFMEEFN